MVSFLVLATCAAAQLAPPALDRLPAGAIHPRGWLKAQAEAQVSGFTGGCTVSPICGIMQNKWLANDNHKLTGGEQGGDYFLNGFMPLTCQVDVGDELRALREATIDKNLLWANQTGGWFGGEIPHGNGSTVPTYWGRMSVVLAFQSYAECEGAYAPTNATAQAMAREFRPGRRGKCEFPMTRQHRSSPRSGRKRWRKRCRALREKTGLTSGTRRGRARRLP